MTRLADASSATGCLPGITAADVEGMPEPIAQLATTDASMICDQGETSFGGGRRFGDAGSEVRGGVGGYLALVRGSNGERYVLRGTNRFDSGRLWVGNPTVAGTPTTP